MRWYLHPLEEEIKTGRKNYDFLEKLVSNHFLQILLEIKEGGGNNLWSWESTAPGAQRDF